MLILKRLIILCCLVSTVPVFAAKKKEKGCESPLITAFEERRSGGRGSGQGGSYDDYGGGAYGDERNSDRGDDIDGRSSGNDDSFLFH